MKIITLFFFIFSVLVFSSSCKKNSSSPTNKVNIANITGNYSGGTLNWTISSGGNVTSGSDPNLKFNIAYDSPDKITLTINTIAPISPKTFELPLTQKDENQGLGTYQFSIGNATSVSVIIYTTIALYAYPNQKYTTASFSYTNVYPSPFPNFNGTGYLQ